MKHEMTELNKPIYAGSAILDLSKTLMYKFHYEFARPKFSKNGKTPELCYMDTDSFIYDIPMSVEERDAVILNNQDDFDCSDYPPNHPLKSDVNKKVNSFVYLFLYSFVNLFVNSFDYSFISLFNVFIACRLSGK